MKKKLKTQIEVKFHHVIQYMLIPIVLVGSDLGIGFYAHYSGSVGDVFSIDNFIKYICSIETQQQLAVIFVIAIAVELLVEWVIRQRLKHHRKYQKK